MKKLVETYRYAVGQQGLFVTWLLILSSPWRLAGFGLEKLGLWMQDFP